VPEHTPSSLVGAAPAYLADDYRLLSDVGRHPLRFNYNDMLVPPTHNKLGDRSFSAAGPRLWNDLPYGLRRPGLTFDSFRQSLKTHLATEALSDSFEFIGGIEISLSILSVPIAALPFIIIIIKHALHGHFTVSSVH